LAIKGGRWRRRKNLFTRAAEDGTFGANAPVKSSSNTSYRKARERKGGESPNATEGGPDPAKSVANPLVAENQKGKKRGGQNDSGTGGGKRQ